jgi:hypothetical protein
MKESLLHYLWRFQKFSKVALKTVDHQSLEILFPGYTNQRGGPDFSEAKIFLDQLYWCGAVELHLKSSDWYRHSHQINRANDSVILHVVWEFDSDVCYPNGKPIPTLELQKYTPTSSLEKWAFYFKKQSKFIPCEAHISKFSKAKWLAYQERLFVERMELRTHQIGVQLKDYKNNWEAVLFIMLAKGFGLNANGTAFSAMALSIPFKRILQLRSDPLDLEALFMGQGGLLELNATNEYARRLFERYTYIKTKFNLTPQRAQMPQFARLRPPNFPTIRLAQLAQLYHRSGQLFQKVVDSPTPDACYQFFKVEAGNYWKNHFNFGIVSKPQVKKITPAFFQLLLLNTLLPFRFAYSKYCGKTDENLLFEWAAKTPAESNQFIHSFNELGVPVLNAMSSQALLHLFKQYCSLKKCLSCKVGFELMKS